MIDGSPSPRPPFGRFDDLRSGRVLQFSSTVSVVVARTRDEVMPALRAVEDASRDGLWAYGFVSYDAAAAFDPALVTRASISAGTQPAGLPLVWFALAEEPAEPTDLHATLSPYEAGGWELGWSGERHAERVRAVHRAIAAGDTYQCNLTTRMTGHVNGDPLAFYRDLTRNQRGAYNAYLDLGRFVIASASPECFFEWSGEEIRCVPMKGTAPRGRDADSDLAARRELLASAKERAENVMIVDLIRNDLSRIARPGTVRVEKLVSAEKYDTVWQLTSTVRCDIPEETTLTDIMSALFPCGSVTGAPKARTMEIISELETSPRGVYCGAIGWVAPPGHPTRARFGVAIRTAVVDRTDGTAWYGVGGGITWDSTPAGEYSELLAKARILRPAPAEFQLIETLRCRDGDLINLTWHIDRLRSSADYFDIPLDTESLLTQLKSATAGAPNSRVRIIVDRQGRSEVGVSDPPANIEPVRLAIDSVPVDRDLRWLYHKTTHRAVFDGARDRHPLVDDVLLVNADGHVTETTTANVAVRVNGTWWTPRIADGCLPGVGRRLHLARGVLRERSITVDDVRHAEGLAVINSLRGWRSAVLAAGT